MPFIPMCAEWAEPVGAGFGEFVEMLAASGEPAEVNPQLVGKEIHEKKPVVFGGDPGDPENKVLVPPGAHAELCRFWNKVHRRIRTEGV